MVYLILCHMPYDIYHIHTYIHTHIHLSVLEGRMTWLTYMVSAVIDAQTSPAHTSDPRKGNKEIIWDGRLCRCVFQLVTILDFRLNSTSGQGKADTKLEIALLMFFRSFKKTHLHETSGWSSKSAVGKHTYHTYIIFNPPPLCHMPYVTNTYTCTPYLNPLPLCCI
jgi:hypothetical protein